MNIRPIPTFVKGNAIIASVESAHRIGADDEPRQPTTIDRLKSMAVGEVIGVVSSHGPTGYIKAASRHYPLKAWRADRIGSAWWLIERIE